MAKSKRELVKIYNIVTGAKKTVSKKLWTDYFSVKTTKGNKEWELAPDQTISKNYETVKEQVQILNPLTIEDIKTSLLQDVGFLSKIKNIICKCEDEITDNCCVTFDHTLKPFNPFGIKEPAELKEWLTSQNIPFTKQTTILESLQKFIPEIYKKQ